jgi:hypothetical protein
VSSNLANFGRNVKGKKGGEKERENDTKKGRAK